MVRLLLFTYIVFQTGWSTAQALFVDWGSDNLRRSSIVEILPDDGLNFYTFRITGTSIIPTPKVSRYVNGEEVVSKKIEQRIEQNMVSLEELVTFNGQLVGFLSDKRDGINSLYMVKYDTEIDPFGEPALIAAYPMPKVFGNRGYFNVVLSKNRAFMCVEYVIPGKRDQFDRYGYKVLNAKFEIVSEGEYEIPFKSNNSSVDVRYLTDNGEYILGVSVFLNADFGVWRDHSAMEKAVIIEVNNDSIRQYDLILDQQRVFDFEVSHSDSLLVVTGTYGTAFSSGAQGVFFQKINLKTRAVEIENFQPFPATFLEEEQRSNQLDVYDRREYRTRFGADLMNYAFRSVQTQTDGSVIVVAEQFYIYRQNTTDGRGMTQTINHYYYNDVVVYRIDANGTFTWIVKLPKEQHSINDYGFYSSLKAVYNEGNVYLFFNDNRKNYDDFGVYTGMNRAANFPIGKNNYAFASCKIHLNTGAVERTVFNEYAETNGIVVLKLSDLNFQKRQLLLYSVGKKERFGVMQF